MNRRLTSTCLAMLTLLAVLAVPTWSQPAGSETRTTAAACPHGIDTATCPFCDPSRIERLGMCREHGVPEALCVKCRPFLRAAFIAKGDWCQEHNTPESLCTICNAATAESTLQRAQTAGADFRWQRAPSPNCAAAETTVTLLSSTVLRTIGLEYTEIESGPLHRDIERSTELTYNASRYARLSARAPGVVIEIVKDLGEQVVAGDVLAVIDSADLGTAKTDLLLALETAKLWEANAARERELVEQGIGIQREAIEAETKAAEARIAVERARLRLRNLGLSRDQIAAVETGGDTSSLLEVTAPFAGSVVERTAVMGEVIDMTTPLLSIADTGTMWAMVDLRESDLGLVAIGQEAEVVLDGLPRNTFPGRLAWISTEIDRQTRTVKARIELDNGSGHLRANMFGRARVRLGGSEHAIMVPKEAVQWEGCCNIAFVRTDTEGMTFRPARLTLAYDGGDRYEVADGLEPGDVVVTTGSFILKNEILRNAIGAGCCEVD